MHERRYIKVYQCDSTLNNVFRYDYTDCLNKVMYVDKYGFWHSNGLRIDLETIKANNVYYKKVWVDVNPSNNKAKDCITHRHRVNNIGLEVIVVTKKDNMNKSPAIVVCLGGPFIPIPNIYESNSIYQFFIQKGFSLIIPLRRGIIGITPKWESSLDGNYGKYDIIDTIDATQYVLKQYSNLIDAERISLYGASYGGYVAELIAGKANKDKLYKSVVAHCGVYDLLSFPWHSQGTPEEIMQTYGRTTNHEVYRKRVVTISPKSFVKKWNVPILLIHHLNDMSSWFGQSVKAYNDALEYKKQVQLLIAPGPHSYEIAHRDVLFHYIVSFICSTFSSKSGSISKNVCGDSRCEEL